MLGQSVGIPSDPAAGPVGELADRSVDDRSSDRDAEPGSEGAPRWGQDSYCAAVHIAWAVLDLRDDLHGAWLWRPGYRTTREQRSEHVYETRSRSWARRDRRCELPDGRIALEPEEDVGLHGSGLGQPPQVFTGKVDEHHVLGAVLL